MTYDLTRIKETLTIPALFTRDGHILKRLNSALICLCPFHEEKTPSCRVEEYHFRCFGCAASGDIFDYWERSRGISKKDAIAQLASLAGLAPLADGAAPLPPRKFTNPSPSPEVIEPITSDEQAAWWSCTDQLASSPAQIERIAHWRGFSTDCVRWAAESGWLGIKTWMGMQREAFLVEMPETPSGTLVPVATHIRLAPHTRGNPRDKAAWHFDPKSRGAWPLVIGKHSSASYIFIVEGQWDAMALIDIMQWHKGWPEAVCVIAMRGASSFRKLLSHYALNERAAVFAIADRDIAGSQWFSLGGFLELLTPKVRALYAFWPGISGADLNDLVLHHGLTRQHLVDILRPKFASPRHAKPSNPTFTAWLKKQLRAPDPLGSTAAFILADKARPKGRVRIGIWERHWKRLKLPQETIETCRQAWQTYRSECSPS